MEFAIRPLSADDARQIAGWRYEGPWRVYDPRPGDGPLDAGRGYRAVTEAGSGRLVGFCCTGGEARVPGLAAAPGVLDVGVGMDPAVVGRGHGREFGRAVLDHLRREHPGLQPRAAVQSWNERSLRLTRALGFVETGRHSCVQDGRTVEYAVVTVPRQAVALRPWDPADAGELLEIFRAGGMGSWIRADITDRAFTALPGVTRLHLLHQVDNAASCRVAVKTGYRLVETLPPAPPGYPGPGHLHVRTRAAG